jgi:hypothetical protein
MDDVQPNTAGPVGMGGGTPDIGNPSLPQVTPTTGPTNELGASLGGSQQPQPVTIQADPSQIAQVAHDSAFGRVAKAILGQQNRFSVGPDGQMQNNPIPETPGVLFRSILGAALLGGAAGANGNPAQGLAGGLARGAGAGIQNAQQQNQQAQQVAQQGFENNQKVQEQNRQATLMNATLAEQHSLQLARQHTSDLQDQEYHDRHNAASGALLSTLDAAGGQPSAIVTPDGVKSDFTAPDLATAYIKNPSILQAPQGFVRHFIDTTDSSNLTFNGTQWVDDSGKPVDMTDKTTVKAVDTPVDSMSKKVAVTGKQVNEAAGTKLVDDDTTQMVSPTEMGSLNNTRMKNDKEAQATALDQRRANIEQQNASTNTRREALEEKKEKDDATAKGVGEDGTPTQLSKDIASGHITADRLSYILAKNPGILDGVMKVDPNFDSTKAGAYPALYKDFTNSKAGSAGGTLNAAATAFKHLDELIQLNTPESHIPGTADYQRYENKVDTVAPELAKVYSDSTIPGIASYKKTLAATFNRDAAIQTQAKSMGDKVDSLVQTWKNGAPSKVYEAKMPGMDDKAMAARARLDPDYKPEISPENGQNTSQPGVPTGATLHVRGSDGNTYYTNAQGQNLGRVQ